MNLLGWCLAVSKLVPFRTSTGNTVMVSEIKVESLKRYISIFPKLTVIRKVILYGSTLEERCTEESDIDLWFVYDCSIPEYHKLLYKLDTLHGDSSMDDFLGCTVDIFSNGPSCDAMYSVKIKE